MPGTLNPLDSHDSSLPAFDNGTSTHISPELVANTTTHSPGFLSDVLLPLVVAIAVPLLLKRALESQKLRALLRFTPAKRRPDAPETADLDFDSD